jgi:hypothetical protein
MKQPLQIVLAAVAAAALLVSPAAAADKDDWRSLFNGKDLTGWNTWLGKPPGGKEAVGLNKDPTKVYTVVTMDGRPAIRISGEVFGALTSQEEFENYHVKLEFKWGEKKWPPRERAVRDSGLLYHCVGPHGAAGSFWMKSLECQIQEHDCGDFWSVAGAIVDVEAVPQSRSPQSPIVYRKGAGKVTAPRLLKLPDGKTRNDPRIIKNADHEKPTGQWNTIEVLTVGQTSVHAVNGKVVMVLTGSRHKVNDREEPLTKGKIQLQSEGAEVFYRNIAVKPISTIPDEYLK